MIVLLICILAIIVFIYFFLRKSDSKPLQKIDTPKKGSIKEDDIVFAQLTSFDGEKDRAVLWNGTPGAKYSFSVTKSSDNSLIAKGDVSSDTGVFIVRNVALNRGEEYKVTVSNPGFEVSVVSIFNPPTFDLLSLEISDGIIKINTDIVPTNIEVIVENMKITDQCKISTEIPGVICQSPLKDSQNITLSVYNGTNVVNIYNKNIRETNQNIVESS